MNLEIISENTDEASLKKDFEKNDLQLERLFEKIEELLQQKNNIIVTIEGSGASGKTTLGRRLEEKFQCVVLHMDDFFLRPEQRTKERLSEPGGNVDRERFFEEVVSPLSRSETIEYRRFDCSTFTLLPAVKIEPDRLTIVEGAYSTHPELGKYYDLSVFMNISRELQKKRILKRNTPDKAERFFREWIPMEQKYFDTFHIKEKCDVIINIL